MTFIIYKKRSVYSSKTDTVTETLVFTRDGGDYEAWEMQTLVKALLKPLGNFLVMP